MSTGKSIFKCTSKKPTVTEKPVASVVYLTEQNVASDKEEGLQ